MDAKPMVFDRRRVLALVAAGAAVPMAAARADALPAMAVFRDPTCGCCHKWVEHLTANGFAVTVHEASSMQAVKARFGVPADLAACHTGEIGGYVIEGHVPASAIKRLLAERPEGRGLAVPGMPAGSPGMEGDLPEVYDVILFGDGPRQSFGRFREDRPA